MIDDRRKTASANDRDLADLESAWRKLPAEEPPELVDRAVLNRARLDLDRPRPRRPGWIGQFATAGIAVVALSIWLLQDPGPAPTGGDDALRVQPADEAAPPAAPMREQRRLAPSEFNERAPQAVASEAPAKGAVPEPEALAEEARPEAADATAARISAADAAEPRPPDAWIEQLLTLQAAGRSAELKAGLAAFRAAYPDYPLPPVLQDE